MRTELFMYYMWLHTTIFTTFSFGFVVSTASASCGTCVDAEEECASTKDLQACDRWNAKVDDLFNSGAFAETQTQRAAALKPNDKLKAPTEALYSVASSLLPFIRQRPGSVVLDIGGHLGMFTEALLRVGAPFRTAYVFEPVHALFLCQVKRLGSSEWTKTGRIRFENFALGSQDFAFETILINDLDATAQLAGGIPGGWNTLLRDDPKSNNPNWVETMTPQRTLVRTLSRVLDERGVGDDVSVVKIDVEGFEGEVLRGALPWLRSLKARDRPLPVFIIEVAWGKAHPYYERNKEVYTTLQELGMCVPRMQSNFTADLLFVPTSLSPDCALAGLV